MNSNVIAAKEISSGIDSSHGCIRSAASIPSNTPWRTIIALPLPFSSAGVPNTFNTPPISCFSITSFNTIPAPAADVPIRLCPQPCPISGRQSYSPISATVFPGFPESKTASKDVGISAIPRLTTKPWLSNSLQSASCDLYSLNASSGFAKI